MFNPICNRESLKGLFFSEDNDKLEPRQEKYRFQVVRRTDSAGGIVQLPGMTPVNGYYKRFGR